MRFGRRHRLRREQASSSESSLGIDTFTSSLPLSSFTKTLLAIGIVATIASTVLALGFVLPIPCDYVATCQLQSGCSWCAPGPHGGCSPQFARKGAQYWASGTTHLFGGTCE